MPTKKLKVLDLFSGIGGFSLGLERAGFKTVAFCEIEKFPQKVLKKNWPDVPIYEDVKNVTRKRLVSDGIPRIDVVTGGFPCQDLSIAGNQKGIEAERSGLWSELCRIIGDVRPRYAIVENVTALISGDNGRWFGKVLGDLVEIGYDAEWHCISASQLGAHHHRDRVWIIAYPFSSGKSGRANDQADRCSGDSGGEDSKVQWGDESEKILAYTINGTDIPNSRAEEKKEKIQGERRKKRQPGLFSRTSDDAEILSNTMRERLEGHRQFGKNDGTVQQTPKSIFSIDLQNREPERYWATEPDVGRVANGIPNRSHRLKGLGNAVVPQIPELIGRAILEAENDKTRTRASND